MEAMRAQFERGSGRWSMDRLQSHPGRPLLNTAKFLAEKASEGGRLRGRRGTESHGRTKVPFRRRGCLESEVTPVLTGLEPAEKENSKLIHDIRGP